MGGSVQNSLSVSFFPAVLELAGQAEYARDQVAGRHVWGRGVSGPGLGEGDGGWGGAIQGGNVFFSQNNSPWKIPSNTGHYVSADGKRSDWLVRARGCLGAARVGQQGEQYI